MKLNPNQKRAVEYLEGPLLVLAGPGTGKTQLLSEKVAYILENVDINPENILCMTFTESGALNMRERLKTIIGNAASRVHISTYHSFGSEILAEYKNYSENYTRKLDSAIDELTQFKIIKEIQANLPANDILRKDNIKDIIEVISSAKSAGLNSNDLKLIAEQNIAESQVLSEQISPLLLNIVPRNFKESYEKAYEPIYDALKQFTDSEVVTKNIEREICVVAKALKDAMITAESEQKIKPLSDWKDSFFEKDEYGNYRLKDRIANKKLLSIANIMAIYTSYLEENGWYDFDDMIQEASRILVDDAGFRATLTERYQFIMLDEFQDTNPAQFQIIKQLTDYEKPLIMAVGDDDQAIYEFQGALSTNLVDFQRHYEANVIPLTENYRSTQEVLDFAQKIINQTTDRFAEKELFAHKGTPEKSQIHRYEFLSSDMEYSFVANKITELIHNGVPQKQIAVISSKHKYFMPLLPYLKAHPEIKIAYEKRDNLFEDEAVHQIFTIAKYIHEIAHEKRVDTPVMEILSYKFWNLPIIDVINTVSEGRAARTPMFEAITSSKNKHIARIGEFLADLVACSFDEPLEIFLDYLIGASELNGFRSPLLGYYTEKAEYDAFRFYENLAILRGKLLKHFGEKKLRLGDLIEMLNDYEEAGATLTASSPYRDADDAIQILSAHKAKGLEFEYVFVIAADHTCWGKGKGNNNLLSLPKNLLQIRHTGTTDGERIRLLYVALTRAKHTLYITNSLHDFNGKKADRLEYLNEYTENDIVHSPYLPAKQVVTLTEATDKKVAIDGIKAWLTPYVACAPDMRALYKERVQNYRMSATSLTSFIDIVYAGPQEFFKNQILGVPREATTESLIFGTLIHAVFEAVTNRHLSDEKALELFREEAGKLDLPEKDKQKIIEKGADDIALALRKFGDILRQGKAEVNFSPEHLVINDVPVSGKIDHIIIDEDAKTIEIYDFKTGGYHKEKWQSHATLYKYMLQLEFYKLLLNHSEKYRKYKVEKAHILFVTPDGDGEIHDKLYIFDEAEEKELLNLMKAVYDQVVSLDFMDDPEIFVASNPNAQLKDIKNFVMLMLGKNIK